jgi:hypothetical protein
MFEEMDKLVEEFFGVIDKVVEKKETKEKK